MIQHLFTRCIRCGRCIRACRDLRGVEILDFQKTKDGVKVGINDGLSLRKQVVNSVELVLRSIQLVQLCAIGIIKEGMSYAEAVVPCKTACHAHTDVPRYLRYIKNGEYAKATAVIREKVPFPETLGNVCNHVCEDACKRNELGEPLSICKLKRKAAFEDDK